MRKTLSSLLLAGMLAMVACSPVQQAAVNTAVASSPAAQKAVVKGQLYCAKATVGGPMVVALVDLLGAPVDVTDLASDVVAGLCAKVAAIPVSPPADVAAVPVVAVAK